MSTTEIIPQGTKYHLLTMLAYTPSVQVKQPVLEVFLVVKMDPREPRVDVSKHSGPY